MFSELFHIRLCFKLQLMIGWSCLTYKVIFLVLFYDWIPTRRCTLYIVVCSPFSGPLELIPNLLCLLPLLFYPLKFFCSRATQLIHPFICQTTPAGPVPWLWHLNCNTSSILTAINTAAVVLNYHPLFQQCNTASPLGIHQHWIFRHRKLELLVNSLSNIEESTQ